ncbi:hypothetical protein TIFTF001_016474 [Ficus carica]|uniref:Uncharacterized protein n=1 Tax=Ficus carica TaxID=3494 RepID=A0AA88AJM4_FICCA|nr:hypothetical protein TIFTF001_016474 [Ficus carica]
MVGYGKSLSHGPNNAHQRPSPYSRKQPIGHLGNCVMLTTQDMLAHNEIHLAQEEVSRGRPIQIYPPINQPPNLLNNIPPRPSSNLNFPNPSFRPCFPPPQPQPYFPGPVVVQPPMAVRPGNNSIPLTLGADSTQINIISRPPNILPPQVYAPARVNNSGYLEPQLQQSAATETHDDKVTRPFLRLLDRPIPKVIGFVDLEEKNSGDKLDLTLKL